MGGAKSLTIENTMCSSKRRWKEEEPGRKGRTREVGTMEKGEGTIEEGSGSSETTLDFKHHSVVQMPLHMSTSLSPPAPPPPPPPNHRSHGGPGTTSLQPTSRGPMPCHPLTSHHRTLCSRPRLSPPRWPSPTTSPGRCSLSRTSPPPSP